MIRATLKGHHFDYGWIQTEFIYWFFAHYFNFDSQQVDRLPNDRLSYMFELEKEFQKKKREELTEGAK